MYVCMYVCSWLRVLGRGNTTECFPGVFSIGDCAIISGKKVKMVVRSDDSLLLSVFDTYYHIQIHFDSLSMLSNNRHSPASHRSGGIATGGLSWQNFLQGDCLHIYVYIHT